MNSRFLVSTRVALGCLLLWLASPGIADPRGDYLNGVKLYNNGDMIGAMALLKSSADAGDADAQAFYAFVLGASELEEESVAYYRKSAAQGNLEGMYGLAGKIAQGEGVKKDPDAAWKLYNEAAARDHGPSINVVAAAYMSGGFGLSEEERKSPKAAEWMRRAGEGGYMPAIDALIKAYRSGGVFGLAADPAQVKYWSDKAASITGVKDDGAKKRKRR